MSAGDLTIRLGIDASDSTKQIQEINKELKSLDKQIKSVSDTTNDYNKKSESLNKQLELQTQKQDALNAKLKAQEKIKEERGKALEREQQKLEALQKSTRATSDEIDKQTKNVEKAQNAFNKANREYAETQTELEKVNRTVEDTKTKINALGEKVTDTTLTSRYFVGTNTTSKTSSFVTNLSGTSITSDDELNWTLNSTYSVKTGGNLPKIAIHKIANARTYLNNILVDGWSDRKKARCLAVIDSRPNSTPVKMFHRYYSTGFTTLIFKDENHYKACVAEYEKLSGGKRKISASELDSYTGHVFDGVRYMYQEELEKCQCVPSGYTKCLTRNEAADVLGDGWNIDVIKWFFSGLK